MAYQRLTAYLIIRALFAIARVNEITQRMPHIESTNETPEILVLLESVGATIYLIQPIHVSIYTNHDSKSCCSSGKSCLKYSKTYSRSI